MRSQLTRSVFRRLLSNEPLVFRCPTRRYAAPLAVHRQERRNLFGFSRKPPREPKDPEIAPGLSKMFDLNTMDKIKARPPPPAELVQAWKMFFKYKERTKESLNNIQAQHAVRTFQHLQRDNAEEAGFGLEAKELSRALMVTTRMPKDNRETHNKLARMLYEELLRRKGLDAVNPHGNALLNFASILADTGDSSAARDIAVEYSATPEDEIGIEQRKGFISTKRRLWNLVLGGYARENNEVELLKSHEMAEAASYYGFTTQEIMVLFYASKNDTANTKHWFSKTLSGPRPFPTAKALSTVLGFSIRNGELDWCKTIFRETLDRNPPKAVWDILFQWAAGGLGKGVEDVERMMDVMIRYNPDTKDRPDVETINGLVGLAMSLNDPYLAERYIALGRKFDIQPDAQTFLLQMDYRISAGDLTGAQVAYEALQAEEIIADCDLPVINRYIRALCASKTSHYDRIVAICSDLEERKVRVEADTVSSLSVLYLSRGQLDDVYDTLQVNVFHYTLPERTSIINTFVAYCLNKKRSTTEVWEAYSIFRHVFQETPIRIRTQMMNEFFARKRSDMACHVFGHMRQHISQDLRPVLDTYIDCFRGIAHCADKESLYMVHNMFKMDSSIEPNTKLYNSLMMAYTACDEGDRAMDFWYDITNSREGPSYESLELVFKACEGMPFGDVNAREVWGKMRRMEIDVTRDVFVAYVGALAGQGRLEEAEGVIEAAEKDLGLKPDALTIGTFYNALPGQNRKDLVEEWAKDRYPDIWIELEKLGQKTMKEGHRTFRMTKLAKA